MKDSQLRILVVLPMYGGSLPIGKYCASALSDLGHLVRVFDSTIFYPTFSGLNRLGLASDRLIPIENAFLQVVGQAIWSSVQAFEPHLILALAQAPLGKSLLQRLRNANIRTAMWFVEDYKLFGYWKLYAPLYDVFAVIQKGDFLSELSLIGQNNSLYLPLAALPSFHCKQQLSQAEMKEYGSDISFLGAGYPNRRIAFRPLANRNFKIWGSDWDGETLLSKNLQRNGARIDEQEGIKIYSASTINLNLHSSVKSSDFIGHGDFVNPRTFELACMEAFQIVDKRSLLSELFNDDELATFDSIETFYSQIDYFLTHEEERNNYSKKARERVIKDHTYQIRLKYLIEYIEEKFGEFKSENEINDIVGNNEFGNELKSLLDSYGLGPNASLDDVISRLREKSGQLSELETSLLFLDEWKKQYK